MRSRGNEDLLVASIGEAGWHVRLVETCVRRIQPNVKYVYSALKYCIGSVICN
jgi:hypothetical protein